MNICANQIVTYPFFKFWLSFCNKEKDILLVKFCREYMQMFNAVISLSKVHLRNVNQM